MPSRHKRTRSPDPAMIDLDAAVETGAACEPETFLSQFNGMQTGRIPEIAGVTNRKQPAPRNGGRAEGSFQQGLSHFWQPARVSGVDLNSMFFIIRHCVAAGHVQFACKFFTVLSVS